MNTDKIPYERLFQNNTKEDVIRWSKHLRYFYYLRDRGGHRCEGDSFCSYFRYTDRDDLISKLADIAIELSPLEEGCIPFDATKSYSFDELDKLRVTIARFDDLEQPRHVEIGGQKAHVWVTDNMFEISVSGSEGRNSIYSVSEEDYRVCTLLEELFDKLHWQTITDTGIKQQPHCVSEQVYPELFD